MQPFYQRRISFTTFLSDSGTERMFIQHSREHFFFLIGAVVDKSCMPEMPENSS